MKKIASIFLLLITSSLIDGHEFWLQPKHFILKPGEAVNIRFQVGED